LRRDLLGLGGDVLHINLPSTYDAGLSSVAVAARMAGYRRVLTTEHLPMIERRYRKFPGKILFTEAVDLVLVPAYATRDFVVRLHHLPWEKTRVIPYGIEEPPRPSDEVERQIRASTATPAGTVTLGIVGRLTARKGHRTLFEALAILRRSRSEIALRLWVIGEGEDRDALERQAREQGLNGIVRFVGPRADAASLMHCLDVLVVPSLIETTPFVILEAMACGRPVVASRVYGIPEMVEHGASGYLVPPEEPEELARVLYPLVADPDLRARFGRRARELYDETFSADRMARATEASYLGAAVHQGAA
jgi:glycosyltransferase involved in cell wall biosynthesis